MSPCCSVHAAPRERAGQSCHTVMYAPSQSAGSLWYASQLSPRARRLSIVRSCAQTPSDAFAS